MKTIRISCSSDYDVTVGSGILSGCARMLQAVHSPCRALVVTDENVAGLYLERVCTSLSEGGFTPVCCVITPGESSKNGKTFFDILNLAAESGMSRHDMMVSLGGGVIGDLTGFCAHTYMRGIPYVQLPTTLLAAVDSSVGGKCAVNLAKGKNLAGAFHQPLAVLCDTDCFQTLPEQEYRCGMGEIVKYAVLDKEICELLCSGCDRQTLVAKCVAYKGGITAADEFDTGKRQLLNLGHTVGHAIERVSGFAYTHGEAVSIGLNLASLLSYRLGITDIDTVRAVCRLSQRYGLPTQAQPLEPEAVKQALRADKKANGESVSFILVRSIGQCEAMTIPFSAVDALLDEVYS